MKVFCVLITLHNWMYETAKQLEKSIDFQEKSPQTLFNGRKNTHPIAAWTIY
jgi:hypothetical protein